MDTIVSLSSLRAARLAEQGFRIFGEKGEPARCTRSQSQFDFRGFRNSVMMTMMTKSTLTLASTENVSGLRKYEASSS